MRNKLSLVIVLICCTECPATTPVLKAPLPVRDAAEAEVASPDAVVRFERFRPGEPICTDKLCEIISRQTEKLPNRRGRKGKGQKAHMS